MDAAEGEKKYKDIKTAYGHFLRKKKSVPSGIGQDAVLPSSKFRLACRLYQPKK